MAVFSPSVGNARNVNKALVVSELQALGTKIYQTQNSSTLHSITQTTPTTVQTVSSVVVEEDDLVTIVSTLWVSGSNTGDRFRIRHTFNGVASQTAEQANFQPAISATHGSGGTIAVVSTFQDQTPGTYSATLQVWAPSGAPTGVFYSQCQTTKVFVSKRS